MLVVRLQDSASRARIRREMTTPGGDWDNEWQEIAGPEAVLIGVVQNPELLPLQGKTLDEIARAEGKDPIDALLDILVRDKAFTSGAVFGMSEEDVALALVQPWTSIDNDSQGTSPDGLLGSEHPHPRAYGTFPRIIRKYVREEHRLTLPDAIRKFTSLPAQQMRLTDRGSPQTGDVGGHRGVRSRQPQRSGDLLRSQPALGRHALRAGQRGAGHRGVEDDGCPAGARLARTGLSQPSRTVSP